MPEKIMQQKIIKDNNISTKKYYLSMSTLVPLNPYFKAKLFEYFDFNIKKAFEADVNDLKLFKECCPNVTVPKNFLHLRDKVNLDKIEEKTLNEGVKFITYEDKQYPVILKGTEDFPLMLYYKGSFDNINFTKTVAFVGSRRASIGAKESLVKIIREMEGTDIVIVSGLAEGIDTVSHKSALDSSLKTIAVIGSGLKYVYPSSNKMLYQQIENESGVIFSEYPYSTSPYPAQFPLRNRIVTGISYGTVVAEAKIKSGAMISARLTLDQGRELMCIPGLITNPNTEGIYYLIKNGATIVTTASDIFETLGYDYQTYSAKLDITDVEKQIMENIALDISTIEKLCEKMCIDITELMVNLTQMELKGLIKQINGSYYISG